MTVSAEEVRKLVIAEIERITESAADSKQAYRDLHKPAVRIQIEQSQKWLVKKYPQYAHFFGEGHDINVEHTDPRLVEVTEPWHADLFRLARLTWSLPYTRGYGRRLRFLILDQSNDKLIGILGLQSPPLDFPARDRLFNYPSERKTELVNQTMDIFTLGAVPPYSRLLGGKLVALAAGSREIVKAYEQRYAHRLTQMELRELPSHLIALTTTSAFGRSSLYNRLKYEDQLVAEPIGYTEGYGSFHLSTIYPILRDYLESQGISTRGGFGVGPRIIWQVCTRAFDLLGLPRQYLKHGIRRQVFLFSLTRNLVDLMEGRTTHPDYYDRPFNDLVQWWKERWFFPRAQRVDSWRNWNREEIRRMLILSGSSYDRNQ